MNLQEDGSDDEAEKIFMQLAEATEDIPFAITKSAELFSTYKVSEPHVVVFKQVCNEFQPLTANVLLFYCSADHCINSM